MFELVFSALIWISLLMLYLLFNTTGLAGRIFLRRGNTGSQVYLERFREHKASKMNRSIVAQSISWIFVLLIFFVLKFQYFYFGTVMSGSMAPVFEKGDLVLFQAVNKEPAVGDIIMFQMNVLVPPYTHRVISVQSDGHFRTKGDANPSADPWVVDPRQVAGKVITIGGNPVVIKGLGAEVKAEDAGKLQLVKKAKRQNTISTALRQVQTLTPTIFIIGTIIFFLVILESRNEYNRRYR